MANDNFANSLDRNLAPYFEALIRDMLNELGDDAPYFDDGRPEATRIFPDLTCVHYYQPHHGTSKIEVWAKKDKAQVAELVYQHFTGAKSERETRVLRPGSWISQIESAVAPLIAEFSKKDLLDAWRAAEEKAHRYSTFS